MWPRPYDFSYRQPKPRSDWDLRSELWSGIQRTLLNFAYTKTFGQWAPLLELIASYLYPRPKRKFEYHFQTIADTNLIHYYPFTNFYFDNHRISKSIYNDPEPNQPTNKVRTTYSSDDSDPTQPPTTVHLISYPSEPDSEDDF